MRRVIAAVVVAALVIAAGAAPAAAEDPPGGRIAFAGATGYSDNGDIYVMNADGSDITLLNDGDPATTEYYPLWSPDGSRISFTSDRGCTSGHHSLYVINADGSGLMRVTGCYLPAGGGAWSPDGTRLVFGRWDTGLYIVNVDGTGVTPLVEGPYQGFPDWSPDGTQIVFQARNEEIYAVSASGGSPRQLTSTGLQKGTPRWSPDGTQIAFGYAISGNWQIYVMNADGSDVTQVTDNPGYSDGPAWSPDGTRIVFFNANEGSNWYDDLYTINVDGSGQVRLTDGGDRYEWQPDWWGPVMQPWPFIGFFAPVDSNMLNVAMAGSAIPVKFSLGGDQGLDIFAVGFPKAVRLESCPVEVPDPIENYAVASTSGLHYDPVADQYTYVWKSMKDAKGCYEFQMKLADGSMHTADFRFK